MSKTEKGPAKMSGQLTCSNPRLLELVDKEVLKKILKTFTGATGLTANVVDTQGRSVFGCLDAQKNCKFCQLIWQLQNGAERCQGAYTRAGKQAAKFGEPYIFRCPAGLIEWAAPIVINGEHLGAIICGQVLMWEPEDFFWIELQEMNRCLGVDLTSLMEAAKELEVVSGEKVQSAADLLFVTANYIMKTGWEKIQHQQELSQHRAMLADEIAVRKALEARLNSRRQSLDNYLEKEKELASSIKLGDEEKANRLLQVLLVDIFMMGAARIPVIKARVTELAVIFSRSAVDGGVELATSLALNTRLIQEISLANSIDEISLAAFQGLKQFLESIQKNTRVKNYQLINHVKSFIRDNFYNNLTLEDIANAVFLSPCYLSRIFKDEQGITIMDYVTRVRIEEAKKLLRNPEYNIEEISNKLGYHDPSHFTKVFRRSEGITPHEYRQRA